MWLTLQVPEFIDPVLDLYPRKLGLQIRAQYYREMTKSVTGRLLETDGMCKCQRWALDIFFIIRYRWFDNFLPVNQLR
jgi:hypothetical protein